MRRLRITVDSALTLALLLHGVSGAAQAGSGAPAKGSSIQLIETGGGELFLGPDVPHPSEEQRREIEAKIDESIKSLRPLGKLPAQSLTPPTLGWPLAPANGLMDFGYHGVSNFVDLNPAFPNLLRDYQCGSRTYDLSSGYNHSGIDYFTWPWGWRKMDNQEVAIVAAAPGVIVFKQDGNFDRSCGFNNNPWNAVYVSHADGSVAWYGHMKSGSLTTKPVGSAVSQGEYLGSVGSSGSSTGPHLHFEVHDSLNSVVEPHAGTCNAIASWWASQRPYFDSAVNKLTTGFAAPVFPACPNPESPNTAINFAPRINIYFTAYYRDQRNLAQDPAGAVSQYRIYAPDGSEAASWTHSSPANYYAGSYWWWSFNFTVDEPAGIWRFEVIYQGVAYNTYFGLGGPFPAGRVPGQGSGMPADVTLEANGDLTVSWDPSCNPGDTDYAIYEGNLGSYYSHKTRFCSTQGLTTKRFAPGQGDKYYLVVPTNRVWEGSYGTSSSGSEIPPAGFACQPQLVGPCL